MTATITLTVTHLAEDMLVIGLDGYDGLGEGQVKTLDQLERFLGEPHGRLVIEQLANNEEAA